MPDPVLWSVVSPNCSGTGTITVDGTVSHSGKKSVRINGKGGYCNHIFLGNTTALSEVGDILHLRFFARFQDALGNGHTTFLAMKDAADGGKDLRMGGQNGILMYNRESDDATVPVLSPAGVALSQPVTPGEWTCVELEIQQTVASVQTSINGQPVAGLTLDTTPTPEVDQPWINQKPGWKPDLQDVRLGWESYAGQDMTLWVDDVAISGTKIGCD